MENNQHLLRYEEKLTEILVGQCTSKGFLDGYIIEIEELDEKWNEIAPEYMVDAIPQVNEYPAVAIAWAAYLGMGVAAMWDGAWDEYKDEKSLYSIIKQPRGFDAMDEYVMEELLGIKTDTRDNETFEELLRGCAHTAMTLIRNEKFEPLSADAFYVFAKTVKVFFRLGVSIELKQLGYKYKKVAVEEPLIN